MCYLELPLITSHACPFVYPSILGPVADFLTALVPFVEPLYGTVEWAAGFGEEEPVEEIQQEIQTELESEYEEWSYIQKGFLFAIIIGCVALYVRITRRRNARNLGYEKTMA